MNGRQVYRFASRILGKALKQAIQQAGLTVDDIDLFIPHQANRRIIESAARYVKLPEDKVFINIDRYGNTSAASIPIALTEALEQGRAKIGDTLAFVAFGAGLTWASAVVKLGERMRPLPVEREFSLSYVGSSLGRALGTVSGSVGSWAGKLVGKNRLN
jgi:3-oxoacyl-[acyl-carrier-protein] synthase-3